MARRGMATVVGLVVSGLLLAGCQSGGTGDPAPGAEPPVRTDAQPLADEFPAFGTFGDLHWQGGRLGDDRVPGPSTYFIRAAMRLSPAELAQLTTRFSFEPATTLPEPSAALMSYLDGAGSWSSSPELDRQLSTPGWPAQVHVRLESGQAYLSAWSQ